MITTWPDGTPRSQNNAFASVPPRGIDKPSAVLKKRGPKTTKQMRTLTALETPAERALRHALRNRSPSFNVAIPSAEANARTQSIAGRPMDARSQ